jgi:hypothetical protein
MRCASAFLRREGVDAQAILYGGTFIVIAVSVWLRHG